MGLLNYIENFRGQVANDVYAASLSQAVIDYAIVTCSPLFFSEDLASRVRSPVIQIGSDDLLATDIDIVFSV